jgi:uncharacterized protein (DUF2147 family)
MCRAAIVSGKPAPKACGRRAMLHWIGSVPLLIAAVIWLAVPVSRAAAAPEGVWLMESRVAVQIFDCGNLLCGRILWLAIPRDPQGRLDRDKHNPDPALRQRPLCGLTIIWGLRSTGPRRWRGGRFYNPDDGKTYNISAELTSADALIARIYLGFPLFGETKTLHRVLHGTSKGWC